MSTNSAAAPNQHHSDHAVTIQIPDIPDDTYEAIRLRADAVGQSIEMYVRDRVIAMGSQARKNEAVAAVRAVLAKEGRSTTMADVVADLRAGRE